MNVVLENYEVHENYTEALLLNSQRYVRQILDDNKIEPKKYEGIVKILLKYRNYNADEAYERVLSAAEKALDKGEYEKAAAFFYHILELIDPNYAPNVLKTIDNIIRGVSKASKMLEEMVAVEQSF